MTNNSIQVVGIGLEGAAGLTVAVLEIVNQATVLVGSDRHLSYFPNYEGKLLVLKDFSAAIAQLRSCWEAGEQVVVLVSGDPLFFGLGRLLLAEFPSESICFYPHFSSIQLAFNRLKLPWQDAKIVSVHGRSLEELINLLKEGAEKIAILTDSEHNPAAIAHLYLELNLPVSYDFWVCENLGGEEEKVTCFVPQSLKKESFAPLNVVILLRNNNSPKLENLPLFGLPDSAFLSFKDRPGLMTKREVRLMVLGELALQPQQVVWDVGAGTGSVAIEIARLCPDSQIFALEKTALGLNLIKQNCQRLQVSNIIAMGGKAPDSFNNLPNPDRVFVGGSGGNLKEILEVCDSKLKSQGIVVLALATLEHLNIALNWFKSNNWSYHLLNIQISRSLPIAQLTRFSPLNPINIMTAFKNE
ncbi:MAG: precorrin-6y C5,15-methyltransferase (decarboxylating) subunit CbiE [Spirulinaceae cyanobacterium]